MSKHFLDKIGLGRVLTNLKYVLKGKLSYGGIPSEYEQGDCCFYTGLPSYDYIAIQNPDPSANPREEGWYEVGIGYQPSSDTTVDPNKTYYIRKDKRLMNSMCIAQDNTGDPSKDWKSIDLAPGTKRIWHGTQAEWDALATVDKDEWDQAEIIDADTTESFNYSTSEQYTGRKWIDGKKIYRKVINTGALPNSTSKSVAHGISNIDTVVRFWGTTKRSDLPYTTCPLPYCSGTDAANYIALFSDSTNVTIVTAADLRIYSTSHVVLEYTKTTN